MLSSSATRSRPAVARAGLAFVVVNLAALTGCAGSALEEPSAVDAVDEAALPEEREPASSSSAQDRDEGSTPVAAGHDTSALGEVQQPLLGNNTCRNVYVSVRNLMSDPITVRSIEYYNASEGRWQTEDLANRTLDADDGLEIWVEDLENAENDMIYSANLLFDHLDHTHNRHFNIPDQACLAGLIMFDLFVE